MRNPYTPGQIGLALHKTIEKHKKSMGVKASITEKKIKWIKDTALKMIDFLEKEMISFNKENPKNKIMAKELVTTVNTTLQMILKTIDELKKK